MKVRITFEINEAVRRSIAHNYGDHGCKATREKCIDWIETEVYATLSDLDDELAECKECEG